MQLTEGEKYSLVKILEESLNINDSQSLYRYALFQKIMERNNKIETEVSKNNGEKDEK